MHGEGLKGPPSSSAPSLCNAESLKPHKQECIRETAATAARQTPGRRPNGFQGLSLP